MTRTTGSRSNLLSLFMSLATAAATACGGGSPSRSGFGDGDSGFGAAEGGADEQPGGSPVQMPGSGAGDMRLPPVENAPAAGCEFDAECAAGMACLGGACQRVPGDGECRSNLDCPGALACVAGECAPPEGGCMRDADCDEGFACAAGDCREADECREPAPDLSRAWRLESDLNLREAVSPMLGEVLEQVADLEDRLCPGAPISICNILGALSRLHDTLATLRVRHRVTFSPAGDGTYTGREQWLSVAIRIDGEWVETTPDVLRIDEFSARAGCGEVAIDPHEVSIEFCGLVRWAMDAVVWLGSEGRFETLEEAVLDACGTDGLCQILSREALSRMGCVGAELVSFTYEGEARVASPVSLAAGAWAGELDGGRGFTGTFAGLAE